MTGLAQKNNNFFGVAKIVQNPQIVKQVEKMYSYRWAIFRIKYFLSFSCKRVFSIKKFRFHIYTPGTYSVLIFYPKISCVFPSSTFGRFV